MTLLNIKASTKDIDLIVPDTGEHRYLIRTLAELGYRSASGSGWARDDGFIFDLFPGKRVHTTKLLDSPLDEGKNIPVKEFNYLYLGVLNYYDIIISKIFRGSAVDSEDCLMLIKIKGLQIDRETLLGRFRETARYDVSEEKVNANLDNFLRFLKKEGVAW